jgi:hypothetical protein
MFVCSMTTQLQPGDPAPGFAAAFIGGSVGKGQSISLSSLHGKKYMGIERTTFVIAPEWQIQALPCKIASRAHAATALKNP